jgi:hypothetical protein
VSLPTQTLNARHLQRNRSAISIKSQHQSPHVSPFPPTFAHVFTRFRFSRLSRSIVSSYHHISI